MAVSSAMDNVEIEVERMRWICDWAPCKVTSLYVRKMSDRERANLKRDIADLTATRLTRHPPSYPYIRQVDEIVSGSCRRDDMPMWTTYLELDEVEALDVPDPVSGSVSGNGYNLPTQHDFDNVISNCDLARLSYFIRTDEGIHTREWLKEAWMRVTLALPSSLFGLMEGEECPITFADEAIAIAREWGAEDFRFISAQETFHLLRKKLVQMSHHPGDPTCQGWLRSLEVADSGSDTEPLESEFEI